MENKLPIEVEAAVNTLEEHKAEGIEVLDVAELTPFATHYVIATSPNPRALKAHADQLEDKFLEMGMDIACKEGIPESGWMIVGAGDVICHLFLAANRREIKLEELLSSLRTPKA